MSSEIDPIEVEEVETVDLNIDSTPNYRLSGNKTWRLIKHTLGTFSYEDTGDHEDRIGLLRLFIVGSNLLCAYMIMFNIIIGWMNN